MSKEPAGWKRLVVDDQERIRSWLAGIVEDCLTVDNFLTLLRGKGRSKTAAQLRSKIIRQMRKNIMVKERAGVAFVEYMMREDSQPSPGYSPISYPILAYLLGFKCHSGALQSAKRKEAKPC